MKFFLFFKMLIFFFGLSRAFLIHAHEIPKIDISSEDAQFNGKEAVLVGDVSVRHRLGQMTAHRMAMIPIKEMNSNKRALLFNISEDVEIQFNGGGSLNCQLAEIDYSEMKGHFVGDSSEPDVIFRFNRNSTHEGDKAVAFVLTTLEMNVVLEMDGSKENTSGDVIVKDFYASGNVVVNFQERYSLHADTAHFERFPMGTKSIKPSSLEGMLYLSGEKGCKLSIGEDYEIISKEMYVDTKREILTLINPRGTLRRVDGQENNEFPFLSFVANRLVYDHQTGDIRLIGDVHITHNGGLDLKTPGEISYQQEGNHEEVINAERDIDITFCSLEDHIQHKIHCPGPMVLHSLKCHLTLHGNGPHQVVVENIFGEVSADQIDIDYRYLERRPFLDLLLLKGAVHLINRFNGHLEEIGGTLHYAMADVLIYTPHNDELFLGGSTENRALFYDEVNKMQMSAPSLVIVRDRETEKATIQGNGDVRFNFAEQEFVRLRQYFKIGNVTKIEESVK